MDFKKTGRYTIESNEDFEPDSNNQVLKNYLEIKNKELIESLEEQELERTELELIKVFDEEHQFTTKDICDIHKLWLGNIYPFAGRYRTVNMSKEGFLFAPAVQIERLMGEFEKNYLSKHTPCHILDIDQIATVLGIMHIEFILIHPFREGNGRIARLLADLMAFQAKRPALNYSSIDQTSNPKGFENYIFAIQAGVGKEYEPIQKIFKTLLEQSIF